MEDKLVIDKDFAREIHKYISTAPTGSVPFDRVFSILSRIEQLPPLKVPEKAKDK